MIDKVISPLRQRMIENMTIRNIGPKTQIGYIRAVKNFAAFLGHPPGQGKFRGHPPLSASHDVERRRRSKHQHRGVGSALPLQGHAGGATSPSKCLSFTSPRGCLSF
jgi:hypothetical protein